MSANFTFTSNNKQYDFSEVFTKIDFFDNTGVYSWGYNAFGQLGDNTAVNKDIPTAIITASGWSSFGSSTGTSLGIKTDGTLWSWGYNLYGQLGTSAALGTSRSSPAQVGTLTNWSTLSLHGNGSVLALKTDGTLWGWGQNFSGQLGLGDTSHRSSPVQVGTLTTWSQVDAGGSTAHMIKTDGTLWSCGYNNVGQLGLNLTGGGTNNSKSSPTQVGNLTDWKQVACGGQSSAAIKTDGTLWTWGDNTYGQLGNNSNTGRSSPAQVGTLTNWSYVTASNNQMAALKTDGTLWMWGSNFNGNLGQNNYVHKSSPVQVGSLTNWKKIAVGSEHVVALKTDGTLWAWGLNNQDQVSLAALSSYSSPTQIGGLATWTLINAGDQHSFALLT